MKVNVQFNCPVSVIVDTETGAIESVHVWDEHLDKGTPTQAHHNDYVPATDAEKAAARLRGEYAVGRSIFDELPLDHPAVVKARAVIDNDDVEWPAWQFDA